MHGMPMCCFLHAPCTRRAYRAKLKESHPDKGGTREAFGHVQRAYAVLMNHEATLPPPTQPTQPPPTQPTQPTVQCGRAALLAALEEEANQAMHNLHTLAAHDRAVTALLQLRGVQQTLGKELDQRLGPLLVSRALLHTDPRLKLVDYEDAAALGVPLECTQASWLLT